METVPRLTDRASRRRQRQISAYLSELRSAHAPSSSPISRILRSPARPPRPSPARQRRG